MDNPTIGFIGAGTLGKGLALALSAASYRVVAVSSRRSSSSQALALKLPGCRAFQQPQEVADSCDLVFITTPDGAIGAVASALKWHREQGVVHCSGALPLDVLQPAARSGALTGSLHPFQTLACVDTPEEAAGRLTGRAFAVEGQGWLPGFLETLASRLGGMAIRLSPGDRAIYHASAVLACGFLSALVKAAADLWQQMGVSQEKALPIILPLVQGTVAGLTSGGIDAAVTGPVVRGDAVTLRAHLEALEARLPRLIPLYCALAAEALALAGARVGPENLDEMRGLIDSYADKHHSQPPG